MAETMLESLSLAIADAQNRRTFCLYDYSMYPERQGGLKPHVVRDERDRGRVVFESDSPREAREFYERETRLAIARAALEAIREPSMDMGLAGAGPVNEHMRGKVKADYFAAQDAWKAMIDAILNGEA